MGRVWVWALMTAELIDALRGALGAQHVLTGAEMAPYLTDWTGAYTGTAEVVLRPASTAEVAAVLTLTHRAGVAVTVQGGNTSVAGGSVPVQGGGVVLALGRLNRVRAVDLAARTAVVEAGLVLEVLQTRLAEDGLDFPLMFAARGSAQIGGVLSTNAGGSNVLRYGNARDLCLGVEAVLPDGQIVHGLAGLRKDNTGYDLKTLLTGAEGTLGVITAAVLKLVPTPKVRATAFLALSNMGAALEVLNAVQDASGGLVEAFEWMPAAMVTAILDAHPDMRAPLTPIPETGVLLELASTRADDAGVDSSGSVRLQAVLLETVERLMADGLVTDGMFAVSEAQRRELWRVREAVLETIVGQGPFLSLDVALPLSRVAGFLDQVAPVTAAHGLRPLLVAHLGDGNIHYAVVSDTPWDPARAALFETEALDIAMAMGGTFSAEHGIGRSKAHVLAARKDPAQLAMMRAIKQALDPKGLMNPGVMI